MIDCLKNSILLARVAPLKRKLVPHYHLWEHKATANLCGKETSVRSILPRALKPETERHNLDDSRSSRE